MQIVCLPAEQTGLLFRGIVEVDQKRLEAVKTLAVQGCEITLWCWFWKTPCACHRQQLTKCFLSRMHRRTLIDTRYIDRYQIYGQIRSKCICYLAFY